ncbi:MAG: ArgE/DapE family deacylase [Rhodospirillaceae bacterium]|nr:ArgE/DapE family deacylase [Rhodospirillaceae bacterium]
MPDADLTAKILEAVDANFDAQIKFTQELVRRPSIRGQEATAQDLMAEAFAEHGYEVDRFKVDPEVIKNHPGGSPVAISYDNAWSVVGSWRPNNPTGRSLVMNGHVDVVPTGPEDMWARPPFDPVIEGDWMYGRGAGDMKSGVVASLYAMAALRRSGHMPAATVHMESVVEEECTGNGALSCLARGYRGDAVLITEPSDERLMSAQVGVIWMKVKVRGVPVHVSVAGTGQNAIEACVPIWSALHGLEETWNRAENKHPAFSEVAHPVNVVVSRIEGGDWTSSVPAWCSFDVRVGLYPDVKVETIQRQLEDCVAEASRGHPFLSNNPPEIEWHGFLSEGYVFRDGEEMASILETAHKVQNGDAELGRSAFTGLTDARFPGLYDGTPAMVYGAKAESIHGFDERVSIESLRRVTGTIALFIADWCGLQSL